MAIIILAAMLASPTLPLGVTSVTPCKRMEEIRKIRAESHSPPAISISGRKIDREAELNQYARDQIYFDSYGSPTMEDMTQYRSLLEERAKIYSGWTLKAQSVLFTMQQRNKRPKEIALATHKPLNEVNRIISIDQQMGCLVAGPGR